MDIAVSGQMLQAVKKDSKIKVEKEDSKMEAEKEWKRDNEYEQDFMNRTTKGAQRLLCLLEKLQQIRTHSPRLDSRHAKTDQGSISLHILCNQFCEECDEEDGEYGELGNEVVLEFFPGFSFTNAFMDEDFCQEVRTVVLSRIPASSSVLEAMREYQATFTRKRKNGQSRKEMLANREECWSRFLEASKLCARNHFASIFT